MKNTGELVEAWGNYLRTLEDWTTLIEDIEPKVGGCGLVYEVHNPIERPGESFAIADMRELDISEPHKHANGEIEVYFVIQGAGRIAVGDELHNMKIGSVFVTPPNTMHVTAPDNELVLAVVNTPPFELDNYVVVAKTDPQVANALEHFEA